MLAIVFFSLIFSSLLWLIYAVRFINDSLAGISFFDAGIANVILYSLLVCVPVFLVWAVFGYVNQYLHNKAVSLQLRKLMGQMKKNQDYSDLLARVLIETEQHINDGFVLSKFDLLIADMNELLSEIIRGCKLASPEQIESLWSKVQNGGKWSFGKVIIEINNSQPNFQKRVFERAVYDTVLGGTIMEFCARYQAVVQMLEKHDQDKLFLNMIETGVMGKVFSILSPVATEIRRGREAAAGFAPKREVPAAGAKPAPKTTKYRETTPVTEPEPRIMTAPIKPFANEDETAKPSLLRKINIFRKKNEDEPLRREPERDPFSIALERSFGESDEPEAPRLSMSPENDFDEPKPASPAAEETSFRPATAGDADTPITTVSEEEHFFDGQEKTEDKPAAEIIRADADLTDTQKTLDNLKKEWAGIRISRDTDDEPALRRQTKDEPSPEEQIISEDNLAYPFGSWTDEQNYRK